MMAAKRLVLGLLLLAGVCVAACAAQGAPPAQQSVTILTGWTGGAFYPLGAALAEIYNREIPGMRATAQFTIASAFNVQEIQAGKAELGFSQSDVAYSAFKRGIDGDGHPYNRLRSMAVIYVNTVQIVVRKASSIRGLADLRGRRIGIGGEPGSGTETATRTIIESYGLSYKDVQAAFMSFAEAAQGLQTGRLDAAVMVASYPVSAITEIYEPTEVELISLDEAAVHRIRSRFPFFKTVIIPKGTYRGQERDVQTIGVDNLLICLDSLPEGLVYTMTKLFFEALPRLAKDHVTARMINAEQAPATPIPLHPGAARYYRERELFE
jgi:TRAP transporter TAXI family solute receptor